MASLDLNWGNFQMFKVRVRRGLPFYRGFGGVGDFLLQILIHCRCVANCLSHVGAGMCLLLFLWKSFWDTMRFISLWQVCAFMSPDPVRSWQRRSPKAFVLWACSGSEAGNQGHFSHSSAASGGSELLWPLAQAQGLGETVSVVLGTGTRSSALSEVGQRGQPGEVFGGGHACSCFMTQIATRPCRGAR